MMCWYVTTATGVTNRRSAGDRESDSDPMTRAVAFETGDIDLLYGNEGLLPLDTFARFSHNPAGVPSSLNLWKR